MYRYVFYNIAHISCIYPILNVQNIVFFFFFWWMIFLMIMDILNRVISVAKCQLGSWFTTSSLAHFHLSDTCHLDIYNLFVEHVEGGPECSLLILCLNWLQWLTLFEIVICTGELLAFIKKHLLIPACKTLPYNSPMYCILIYSM